jgi:hypothetical protein
MARAWGVMVNENFQDGTSPMADSTPPVADSTARIADDTTQVAGGIGAQHVPDGTASAPGEAAGGPVAGDAAFSGTSAAAWASPSPGGEAAPPDVAGPPGAPAPAGTDTPLLPAAYSGATSPPPEPRRKSTRTKIIIAASAGLAVIVAAVVVVLSLPHVPPVLRPAGLSTGPVTYTTVRINWSGPQTGPRPTRYLIFQDGSQIGSVSGRVTTYEITGLTPATGYRYQVQAIRQHLRSPISSALSVSTGILPPISEALLTGSFTVTFDVKTWHGFTARPSLPVESFWSFYSPCFPNSCAIVDGFVGINNKFEATLRGNGAKYTGTAVLRKFTRCGSVYVPDNVIFRLTVDGAVADGSLWPVTSWTGTMTLSNPAIDGCVAAGLTAKITGTAG